MGHERQCGWKGVGWGVRKVCDLFGVILRTNTESSAGEGLPTCGKGMTVALVSFSLSVHGVFLGRIRWTPATVAEPQARHIRQLFHWSFYKFEEC